jgi:anti-anti-sigma factor
MLKYDDGHRLRLDSIGSVSPIPFEVKNEELEDGVQAVTVRGELDMNTAPELEQRLEAALVTSNASVMLDLSECEFIDSTGIALIVHTWQKLEQDGDENSGGRLVLCCNNHQVKRLLKITGIDSSISMHEERDAALAELRG